MRRMGKTLKQEENQSTTGGPTRIKTTLNQHPLRCSACDDLYYVDESIHHEFMRAIEYDPTDNRFLCDGCAEEQAEDEHSQG